MSLTAKPPGPAFGYSFPTWNRVSYARGFLLSRPVPGAVLESLLAEGRVPVHFSATPRA